MFFNLFSLLTAEGGATDSNTQPQGNPWTTWIIMGVAIALIIVMMILSRRSQKKKQDETNAMLDAIKPGNKVKTIGGICGVVVEVCKEDNTFILETGSEASGKSYIKFDKQAVYQTDAKVPTQTSAPNEETKEENQENTQENAPAGEVFTEVAPQPAPETAPAPAAEPVQAPATEPAPQTTEEKAE